MANGYVYLLVEPSTTDHPMNKILAVGHHLYEVRHHAEANKLDVTKLEVWRMRAGKVDKNRLDGWLSKI